MDNKLTYAVGYCRFSSDNQRNESIDAQKRAIQNYADENNIIVTNWYLDYAQSGTSADRKEFQKMIEASKYRNFSMVLVHKLDRFSRSKYDNAIYKHKLQLNGVRVISATETISNTPEGALMEGLLEMFAELYSKASMGLGLYLSNKIINTLNGSIRVSSEENKGAEFSIIMPDV